MVGFVCRALSGEHLLVKGRYGMRIGLLCFDATRNMGGTSNYTSIDVIGLCFLSKFKQLDRVGNF